MCKRISSEISSEPESHTDQDKEASGDAPLSLTHTTVANEEHQEPPKKKQHLTPSEKKRSYKAKLSYKGQWDKKHPCVPGALVSILVVVSRNTPVSQGHL